VVFRPASHPLTTGISKRKHIRRKQQRDLQGLLNRLSKSLLLFTPDRLQNNDNSIHCFHRSETYQKLRCILPSSSQACSTACPSHFQLLYRPLPNSTASHTTAVTFSPFGTVAPMLVSPHILQPKLSVQRSTTTIRSQDTKTRTRIACLGAVNVHFTCKYNTL